MGPREALERAQWPDHDFDRDVGQRLLAGECGGGGSERGAARRRRLAVVVAVAAAVYYYYSQSIHEIYVGERFLKTSGHHVIYFRAWYLIYVDSSLEHHGRIS